MCTRLHAAAIKHGADTHGLAKDWEKLIADMANV
jgi:hypothetical protein